MRERRDTSIQIIAVREPVLLRENVQRRIGRAEGDRIGLERAIRLIAPPDVRGAVICRQGASRGIVGERCYIGRRASYRSAQDVIRVVRILAAARKDIAGRIVCRQDNLSRSAQAISALPVRCVVLEDVGPNSIRRGAELHGDTVYFDGGDESLYAISAGNGALIWKANTASAATRDLLVSDTRVYYPTQGTLKIYDKATGAFIAEASVKTINDIFETPAAAARSRVFVVTTPAAVSFDEP
jgi:hypothetical protein